MNNMIKVRPVERKDVPQVASLLQRISDFLPNEEDLNRSSVDFLEQSHVHAFVALDKNNQILGYGSLCLEKKIRGGVMGHVEDIVTHPEHEGKGIGRLIMKALSECARKSGCYKLALQCREKNIIFYEKNNYQKSGVCMQAFL